jgi:hypothetical protein
VRFEDTGATVVDHITGLEWEKKTTDGSVHDVGSLFTWTAAAAGTIPDGTVFTSLLGTLNDCYLPDSSRPGVGGFADHCDWRLPSIDELRTIVDQSQGVCSQHTGGCVDPIFGPVAPNETWSSTSSFGSNYGSVFALSFGAGFSASVQKSSSMVARAVRTIPAIHRVPVCGDGILDTGSEECDGNNFSGRSCATEFDAPRKTHFDPGPLACDASCKIDTSGCPRFRGSTLHARCGWLCGEDRTDVFTFVDASLCRRCEGDLSPGFVRSLCPVPPNCGLQPEYILGLSCSGNSEDDVCQP